MRRVRQRLSVLLALAIPVLAGLAYLSFAGAPSRYLAINGGALVLGLAAALLVSKPASAGARRSLAIAMLAALFLPLLIGPSIAGVARWLPLGPFALHSAGLLLPPLLALALTDEKFAAPILVGALCAGLLQPDAAIGIVIAFASAASYRVTGDKRVGLVSLLALFATVIMAMRGNPPPEEFVERVLVDATASSAVAGAGLVMALATSLFLILRAIPAPKAIRHALAASLLAFTVLSLLGDYPSVLIGYGAAPILGFGIALALGCVRPPASPSPRGD